MLNIRYFVSLAVCLALALPTTAAILKPRDMQSMQEAFDHIFTGIDNIMTSVNSFNGDPAGVAAIVSGNVALRNAIDVSATKLKASPGMAIFDLIHIGGPLFVMENKISEMIDALHSKKTELEKSGAGKAILEELQKDKTTVDPFVKIVNGNLPFPTLLTFIADPIGKIITNKLDLGIKEWGGK